MGKSSPMGFNFAHWFAMSGNHKRPAQINEPKDAAPSAPSLAHTNDLIHAPPYPRSRRSRLSV